MKWISRLLAIKLANGDIQHAEVINTYLTRGYDKATRLESEQATKKAKLQRANRLDLETRMQYSDEEIFKALDALDAQGDK